MPRMCAVVHCLQLFAPLLKHPPISFICHHPYSVSDNYGYNNYIGPGSGHGK